MGRRRFLRKRPAGRPATVVRALAQFAIGGLVATLVLGFVGVAILRDRGQEEATRDAKRSTSLVARAIVEPALGDDLLRGDPAAVARMDRVVRQRALDDPLVRVKIWAPDGRIVYSDEPRLIGSRFPLGADEEAVLADGGVEAGLSDLSEPENRFERRDRRLLEVYMPIRTPSGHVLLFEAYQRYASVTASARSTWTSFLPALVVALVILQLVQLPLAARMARRVRRSQADRVRLLRRAVDASDTERRRIAGDLHDGVVQSLAGVSFSLAAAADRADRNGGRPYADELRRGAAATRGGLAELRTLLVKIYPPSLQQEGLTTALDDLVTPLRRTGVAVTITCPGAEPLPPGVDALFFRVAQEAVRNIAAHAQATNVTVELSRDEHWAGLVVGDDGRGFDPGVEREGHLGLRLLADLVADAGGDLTVRSAPGAGTRVEARVELT